MPRRGTAPGTAPAHAVPDGDRVLRGAVRQAAMPAAVLGLAGLLSTGAGLLLPAALGRALDLLLARDAGAGRHVALCAALICGAAVLDALTDLLGGTTAARSTAWLRHRLLRHVLAAGPRVTARIPPGDLVTRLVGNTADAASAPATVATTAATVVGPLGAIVALAVIDPWLAAAFLAGAPLLFLLLRSFARASTDCAVRYQRIQGDIAGRLAEAVVGARTIAAAGTAGRERARILAPLGGLSRQGHRMWRVQGRAGARAVTLVPLLQITVLAVAGVLLSRGRISVGDLLAASRYAVLATGVGMLTGRIGALVRARAAGRRIAEVLAVPAVRHGTLRLPPGPGTLELRGVGAVRGGRPVLDGVDLVVPGGTSLAVVGRSGSGKSVLAALAGRLADPDSGTVALDGVPLPDLSHDELRRAVGHAFERPALLGATVGDALAFGVFDPGREAVTAAARAACADGFVRRLPEGYDTPRTAAPLSGGEAQRLGLARAFAHAGRVLVLDDATSGLDSPTEREVGRALAHDVAARTRVIVARRASTAARADRVAWLDDGRLRATGTHAELWRLPEYRAVFGAV